MQPTDFRFLDGTQSESNQQEYSSPDVVSETVARFSGGKRRRELILPVQMAEYQCAGFGCFYDSNIRKTNIV